MENAEKEIGYYKGIQYKADIKWGDKTFEIGDGGFVDWTQQFSRIKKNDSLSRALVLILCTGLSMGCYE